MNTDDYLDGSDPSAYGTETRDYANAEQQTRTLSVNANATGPVVTGNAQVSTLRPGLEGRGLGSSLGDFDATQRCFVGPLSKLVWAFLATTGEGRTYDALGILSVYRALFNSQRAAIVSGLSAAARDALPVSLPEDAWTDAMRSSMQILFVSVSSRAEQARALAALPGSVAEIPAWFAANRSLWSASEAQLRTYLEVPRGESVASSVLAAVRSDVDACLARLAPPDPVPDPATIGPVAPIRCPPRQMLIGGRCMNVTVTPGPPRQNPRGAGTDPFFPNTPARPAPSGGGLLLVVVAALAAGVWWVMRDEERIANEKALRALDETE
jgi:hypothetical protein